MKYLEFALDSSRINYTVYTDSTGRFTFSGDSLVQVLPDLGGNYRIVALVPSDTKYTYFKTLDQLYYIDHYLGCHFDKKGKEGEQGAKEHDKLGNKAVEDLVIKIYPNPIKDILYVSGAIQGSKIRMFNILGQKIFENDIVGEQVLLSGLTDGVYTVEVVGDGGQPVYRSCVIKQID